MNPAFSDNPLAIPSAQARPAVEYPFQAAETPDRWTRTISRPYRVAAEHFEPAVGKRYSWVNYLKRSEEIDHADWTKAELTILANQGLSTRDGEATIDQIFETTANALHQFYQYSTAPAGDLEATFYAAKGTRRFLRVYMWDPTAAAVVADAVFDLESGACVSNAVGEAGVICACGPGFRLYLRGTAANANAGIFFRLMQDSGTETYAGSLNGALFVTEAQITATGLNPKPAPYISTTDATRGITSPFCDPGDLFALLVSENRRAQAEGFLDFARVFARVPLPQVETTTLPISKPPFPSADFEEFWVDNTTSEGTVNVWGVAEPVTVSRFATGGTFTVSYKTSTTAALAYDASDATIKAAIDALADMVTDGRTVTVTNDLEDGGLLTLVFSGAGLDDADLGFNTASLSPACVSAIDDRFSNTHYLRAARTTINVEYPGHGETGTFDIRYLGATTGGGTVLEVTRVDDNNFSFPNADAVPPITFDFARVFLRTYTPGLARIRARRTSTYYLPGYTDGVATAAEIPIPAIAENDNVLLLAVCESLTGYIDYSADALDNWLGGPIKVQTVIAVDSASF